MAGITNVGLHYPNSCHVMLHEFQKEIFIPAKEYKFPKKEIEPTITNVLSRLGVFEPTFGSGADAESLHFELSPSPVLSNNDKSNHH